MEFEDRDITLAHLQGQLLALQQVVQVLMRAAPDPHGTWLLVSARLDGFAQDIETQPRINADLVAGIRDTSAQLSIQAPRPRREPPS